MWFKHKPSVEITPAFLGDEAAKLICGAFSSSNLSLIVEKQELGENWTLDDALAVWYSTGDLVMVLSVNAAFRDDRAKMDRFYGICRPALARHWSMPTPVLDKFEKVVDGFGHMASRFFEGVKSGDDLRLFFSWCANRILGVPVPRPMNAIESLSQLGIPSKAGLTETELVHKSFMNLLQGLSDLLKEYAAYF